MNVRSVTQAIASVAKYLVDSVTLVFMIDSMYANVINGAYILSAFIC